MSIIVEAVFEGGVLRPLEPLNLPDHSLVRLSMQIAPKLSEADKIARQKAAIARSISIAEQLTADSPSDGWSARDHDQALYGNER